MAPSPRKPKDFLSFGFALLLKPPRLPRRSFNLHPQRAGREVHTMVVTLRQIISEVRAAPTLEDAMAVIIQQVIGIHNGPLPGFHFPFREFNHSV